MDPLTITTGVIAILQATSAIISLCYDFKAALKNEPWSLTTTINGLKDLRNVLEKLEELTQNFNMPLSSSNRPIFELLSNSDDGPLVICERELSFLEKKIRASTYSEINGSRSKAILQALRWQFKDKDAKECMDRIERCKTTLSLALSADQA